MVSKKLKIQNVNPIGQIFTPDYIAKFMIKNSIKFINDLGKSKNETTVLEPSVGKGIFLKYLIQENFRDITAYEIDENLKDSLLKQYPEVNFNFVNVLSSDFNEKFDLIIGNPPYLGQNYNAEIFQDYLKKFPICDKYFVGNMDLFYFFIHIGILKLNPGGILSFITTNYWITKSEKTGIKFLKPHIIDECFLLQYIDLSHLTLFKGAEGQHNCIFVLQKKTKQEKLLNINKSIEIIKVNKRKVDNQTDDAYNKNIFMELNNNNESNLILKFNSALTNKDLKRVGSWNLIYTKEVKNLVEKIEYFCTFNNKLCLLKDYFIIRNGLIFIKDDIFILKENFDLKIHNNDFYIKINNEFLKINDSEKRLLKKVYKSKSIKPYGFLKKNHLGFALYFNKNEFSSNNIDERNRLYDKKYPVLTKYLKQFKDELKRVLINAKENPNDIYFPRRGTFIRRLNGNNEEELVDLEPMYEISKKIFFKYISSTNVFGYTNTPYLATSDTYFLWPKSSEINIDYLFILAYLNSKIVRFLFRAKNIKIKRSKTKLEHELPIPNLNLFNSENSLIIIPLIRLLTKCLIELNSSNDKIDSMKIREKLIKLTYFSNFNRDDLISEVLVAIKSLDDKFIQNLIDKLFLQLFEIEEAKVDSIINKYYQF